VVEVSYHENVDVAMGLGKATVLRGVECPEQTCLKVGVSCAVEDFGSGGVGDEEIEPSAYAVQSAPS
jgi:hypothetical protein